MIPLITELPQYNNNLFDCISNKIEYVVKSTNTQLIDYMVTVYPRNEGANPFDFVYGLFDYNPSAFAHNQDSIISIASELFADSEPLGSFESVVLNKTFKRLLKSNPTLSGRK